MSDHHHSSRRTRYKKGNGIAVVLFTLEWTVLALTGIAGKMFGTENWQLVQPPNFITVGIAAFGGFIACAFIGRWLLGLAAKYIFGGDEDRAIRLDRIVLTVTLISWMVLFCIGINEFNKATYGENWAEETRQRNKERRSQSGCQLLLEEQTSAPEWLRH